MLIAIANPLDMVQSFREFIPEFEHRIRRTTTDSLKSGNLILLIFATVGETKLGFTALLMNEDGKKIGVTVVKRSHRNQGIGTAMLRFRLMLVPNTVSKVEESNLPSRRICVKNNMHQSAREYFKERIVIVYKKEKP